MRDLILIRYGELSTKGKNSKLFINQLATNVKKTLSIYPNTKITYNRDRMYVEYDSELVASLVASLKNVFGIHSFSLAKKVTSEYETIEDTIMSVIDFAEYNTFKVITKRADKSFTMSSDEINRRIAKKVLDNTSLKVKMKDFDLSINIEIRKDATYIFFKRIEGAKGYPVGSNGKGLLMMSGGIDSPVAGYLIMKRGVRIELIHFASPPYTSSKALNKIILLALKYLKYTDQIILHNVAFTDVQLAINKHVLPAYSMTIMRRIMYRISEKYARYVGAKILVNGESIAQVASQTLDSMVLINEVVNMPVIRPVACLDKLEIIDLAKKIDTYETSILPYEDCCTIFLPPNPIIYPKRDIVLENEANLDIDLLIREAIDNSSKIIINNETINDLLKIDEDLF